MYESYLRKASVLMALTALISMYFTFEGFRQGSDKGLLYEWILPLAVALVSGAVSLVVWPILSRHLSFGSYRERVRYIPLVLFFILFVYGTSTQFVISMFAGQYARKKHLSTIIFQAYRSQGQAHTNFIRLKSLVPSIQNAREYWQKLFSSERDYGAVSGQRGNGKVLNRLRDIKIQYANLSSQFTHYLDRQERHLAQGSRHLQSMKRLSSRPDLSIDELESRIQSSFLKLQPIFLSHRQNPLFGLRLQIQNMEKKLASGAIVRGWRYRRVRASYEKIKRSLKQTNRDLIQSLNRIELQNVVLPYLAILPTQKAIDRYYSELHSQILIALSIDIFCPLLLIMLLTLSNPPPRENKAPLFGLVSETSDHQSPSLALPEPALKSDEASLEARLPTDRKAVSTPQLASSIPAKGAVATSSKPAFKGIDTSWIPAEFNPTSPSSNGVSNHGTSK
ncbi:MAG: hypothetical protein AAFQ94_25090 [Bacteroidota bacterium]